MTDLPGTSAADLRRRAAALAAFDAWQERHPDDSSAAQNLSDVGAIYALLPAEARAEDPDPQRLGVRRLHRDLARIAAGRR